MLLLWLQLEFAAPKVTKDKSNKKSITHYNTGISAALFADLM